MAVTEAVASKRFDFREQQQQQQRHHRVKRLNERLHTHEGAGANATDANTRRPTSKSNRTMNLNVLLL